MAKKEDKITMIPPVAPEISSDEEMDEEWSEGDEGDDEEDDIVTLMDAEGNETDFLFLTVIDVEGEGQFAALTPADEDEETDNTEVFLFHYEADEDGGESFAPIEDEDLFAKVQAAAEVHFAQMEHDEECGEEHDHAGHSHDHKHGDEG